MKSNFTAAIAVFAVAIMLGAALVPLMSEAPVEASTNVSEQSKTINEGGLSVENLLELLLSESTSTGGSNVELDAEDILESKLIQSIWSSISSDLTLSKASNGASAGDLNLDIGKLVDKLSEIGYKIDASELVSKLSKIADVKIDDSKIADGMSAINDTLSDVSIDSLGLADILSAVKGLNDTGSTGYVYDYNDYTLVPVEGPTEYSSMTVWDGTSVSEGTVGLYNNAAVDLTSESGIIGEGATLVVFPVGVNPGSGEITNYSFTVTNTSGYDRSIYMKSGSYLDIFGCRYMVVVDNHYYYGLSLTTSHGSFTVDSGLAGGNFKAYLEIGANSDVAFLGDHRMYNTTGVAQTSADAAVKIDAAYDSAEKEYTNVTMIVDAVEGVDGSKYYHNTVSVSVASLKFSTTPDTTKSADKHKYGLTEIVFGDVQIDSEGRFVISGQPAAEPADKIDALMIPGGTLNISTEGRYDESNNVLVGIEFNLIYATQQTITADVIMSSGSYGGSDIENLEIKMVNGTFGICRDDITDNDSFKVKFLGDFFFSADKFVSCDSNTSKDYGDTEYYLFDVTDLSITGKNFIIDWKVGDKDVEEPHLEVSAEKFDAVVDSIAYSFYWQDVPAPSGIESSIPEEAQLVYAITFDDIDFGIDRAVSIHTDCVVGAQEETVTFTFGGAASLGIGEIGILYNLGEDVVAEVTVSSAGAGVDVQNGKVVKTYYSDSSTSSTDAVVFDLKKGLITIGEIAGTITYGTGESKVVLDLISSGGATLDVRGSVNFDTTDSTLTEYTASVNAALTIESTDVDNMPVAPFDAVKIAGLEAYIGLSASAKIPASELSEAKPSIELSLKDSYICVDQISLKTYAVDGVGAVEVPYQEIDVKNVEIRADVEASAVFISGMTFDLSNISSANLAGAVSIDVESVDMRNVNPDAPEEQQIIQIADVDKLGLAITDVEFSMSSETTTTEPITKTDLYSLKAKINFGFENLNYAEYSYSDTPIFMNLSATLDGVEIDVSAKEVTQDAGSSLEVNVKALKIAELSVFADYAAYGMDGIAVEADKPKIALTGVDINGTIKDDVAKVFAAAKLTITADDIAGSYSEMIVADIKTFSISLEVADTYLEMPVDLSAKSVDVPTKGNGTVTLALSAASVNAGILTGEPEAEPIPLASVSNLSLTIIVIADYDSAPGKNLDVSVEILVGFEDLSVNLPEYAAEDYYLKDIVLDDVDVTLDVLVTMSMPLSLNGAEPVVTTEGINVKECLISVGTASVKVSEGMKGVGDASQDPYNEYEIKTLTVVLNAEYTADSTVKQIENGTETTENVSITGEALIAVGSFKQTEFDGTETTAVIDIVTVALGIEDLVLTEKKVITKDSKGTESIEDDVTTTVINDSVKGKLAFVMEKGNSSMLPYVVNLGVTLSGLEVEFKEDKTDVETFAGHNTVIYTNVPVLKLEELSIYADSAMYATTGISVDAVNPKVSLTEVDATLVDLKDSVTATANAALEISADSVSGSYAEYSGEIKGFDLAVELNDVVVSLAKLEKKTAVPKLAYDVMPIEVSGMVTLGIAASEANVIMGEAADPEMSVAVTDLRFGVAISPEFSATEEDMAVTINFVFSFADLDAEFKQLAYNNYTLYNVVITDASASLENFKIVATAPTSLLSTFTGDVEVKVTLDNVAFAVKSFSAELPFSQASVQGTDRAVLTIAEINYNGKGRVTVDITLSQPAPTGSVSIPDITIVSVEALANETVSIKSATVVQNSIELVKMTNFSAALVDGTLTGYNGDEPIASVGADKLSLSVGSLVVGTGTLNPIDINTLSVELSNVMVSVSADKPSSMPNSVFASLDAKVTAKKIFVDTSIVKVLDPTSTVPTVMVNVSDLNVALSVTDFSVSSVVKEATPTEPATTTVSGKLIASLDVSFNKAEIVYPGEVAGTDAGVENLNLNLKGLKVNDEYTSVTTVVGDNATTAATNKLKFEVASFGAEFSNAYFAVSGVPVSTESASFSFANLNVDATYDVTEKNVTYLDAKLGEVKYNAKVLYADLSGFQNETDVTITDVAFAVSNVAVSRDIAKTPGVTTLTVGEITLDGTVRCEAYLNAIRPAVSLSIVGVTFTQNESANSKVAATTVDLGIKVRYDGIDRVASLSTSALDIEFATAVKSVAPKTKVSVGSASASVDMPFKTMNIGKLIGVDRNVSATADVSNLVVDALGEKLVFTADKAAVTSKTPVDYAPYIEEYSAVFDSNVAGNANEISADSITGYLKNYGEAKQNFSIVNSPKLSFASDTVTIEKGNATFAAGYIPLNVAVKSSAVFVADGLSANNFVFEKGAILSGVVCMDTKENINEKMTERSIKYDGQTLVAIKAKSALFKDDGYKVLFDIGTLGGGKIVAPTGMEIPVWSEELGTKWNRSDDHTSATYDTGTGAQFSFACDRLAYMFSYAGGEKVEKKYGETFKLSDVPAKEGFSPLGWNDGSDKTYAAGAEYTMPARDVVLNPVYVDVAPQVVTDDKNVLVTTTQDTSVLVKTDDISKVKEDGVLTIKVTGAKVEMSKDTITGLEKEREDPTKDLNLVLSVVKVTNIDDPAMKEVVKDNNLYNISLMTDQGDKFTYTNGQVFTVTVTVKVNGSIEGFNITYISDEAGGHAVGVKEYKDNGDGTFDVTFECNHFSDYMIEPVYSPTPEPKNENLIGLYVALILIVIIALGILAMNIKRNGQ